MTQQVPEIIKAERDLTGLTAITFKGDPENIIKAFSDIRAGISWPVRALPGYLCILGLLSGAQVGQEGPLMLIYEREYLTSNELMSDAYNRANDLRFHRFYSDLKASEWQGFNFEFQRKVRHGLGARDIRLEHSYLAHDFGFGLHTIKRLSLARAFILPQTGILIEQLRQMTPDNLETDRPEYKFAAVNAFRFVVVAFDKFKNPVGKTQGTQEREISVKEWA